jgi:hypothetical protein
MRSNIIVVITPVINDATGISQIVKSVLVQAAVSEATIE